LELSKELRENRDTAATIEQAASFGDLEERFHLQIIHATRNRWLSKIAGDLFRATHAFTPLRTQSGLMNLRAAALTWRGHVRLVRALEARDRERAHALMLGHIRDGRRYVFEFLKNDNDGKRKRN
jgi:DNA-binding GntR family transcriptional regulator